MTATTVTKHQTKRIGLLATGTELSLGEVLNTNSYEIAKRLFDHGMICGEHIICDDHPDNLKASLAFLMERHDAVITIGGLGPTEDDLTRNIISDVSECPLLFNEPSWQRIKDRLQHFNVEVTDNNRQQAYFPQGATIIKNTTGSANGCVLALNPKVNSNNKYQAQLLMMLPGPPGECLPMLEQSIIPALKDHNYGTDTQKILWRTMGIGESTLADQIKPIVEPFDLEVGYRFTYPFVDVKVYVPKDYPNNLGIDQLNQQLKPYTVSREDTPLSNQLSDYVAKHKHTLRIMDTITRGQLAAKIITPNTQDYIDVYHRENTTPQTKHKSPNDSPPIKITLTGFEGYWNSLELSEEKTNANPPTQLGPKTELHFTLLIDDQGEHSKIKHHIPYRGPKSLLCLIEWFSAKLLDYLKDTR